MNVKNFRLSRAKKGTRIYGGYVRLGETVTGEELELSFADLRYWISLSGVKETGIGFFFTSVFIGTGGILLRFLFPDHHIRMDIADGLWSIKGYSSYSQEIFREKIEDMVAKLELDCFVSNAPRYDIEKPIGSLREKRSNPEKGNSYPVKLKSEEQEKKYA